MEQQLIGLPARYSLSISVQQAAAFQTHMELPLEWDERMNPIVTVESQQIMEKHFLDSLLLLKAVEIPENARVIGAGTGAGFSGILSLLCRTDVRPTLLDSPQKRLNFLQAVCDALGLSAGLTHARAEEGGRQSKLREQPDLACVRAAAPLPILCKYCLPPVRHGGTFVAIKGPGVAEESVAVRKVISISGVRTENTQSFILPGGNERNVIICRKTAAMSDKYPRYSSKIAKSLL